MVGIKAGNYGRRPGRFHGRSQPESSAGCCWAKQSWNWPYSAAVGCDISTKVVSHRRLRRLNQSQPPNRQPPRKQVLRRNQLERRSQQRHHQAQLLQSTTTLQSTTNSTINFGGRIEQASVSPAPAAKAATTKSKIEYGFAKPVEGMRRNTGTRCCKPA